MFIISDLKQTRVYQARQEGRQEGEKSLVLRILDRYFGKWQVNRSPYPVNSKLRNRSNRSPC
jgi:hypothetical protein